MAEKVVLVDDLDGTDAEDVTKRDFELLGQMFTIDLTDENDKRLRVALETVAQYLDKAREVKTASKARKTSQTPRIQGYTNAEVREWAKSAGIEVSERGKISDEVYTAFIKAHPDAKPE